MIALALSHLKYVGCVVALALGCLLLVEHDRHVRDTALASEHDREARHVQDSLVKALHSTDAALRDAKIAAARDSLRASVSLTHAHHQVSSYHAFVDSLKAQHADTAAPVAGVIAHADSAVASQDTALTRCAESRKSDVILQSLQVKKIGELEADTTEYAVRLKAARSLIPSRMQRVTDAATWGAVGGGIVLVLHAVGVIR